MDVTTNPIRMSPTDYAAVTDAHDFARRALSAAQAAEPFDSTAMVSLDQVRSQLRGCLIQLQHIRDNARVTL